MTESGLTLAPQCSLRDADELKASLAALLELPHDITVDARAVERVDTATLQLLTAFVRTRLGSGRVVRWNAPSAALLAAAQRLGLTDCLSLTGAA